MKVRWFAHASFLIEGSLGGNRLRIITDPYTPAKSGFQTITEPADIVLRSSDDDSAHANAAMITGNPEVVTATHIGPDGVSARGLRVTAIPAKESMIHKLQPRDNALYAFSLEEIHLVHFGDVGNRLEDWQLSRMAAADVVFVPTGGPPTIELDDLADALDRIQPRLIIPMHYALPGCKFPAMLPISDFTSRFPSERVIWAQEPIVEITQATLPAEPHVMVMQATTTQESAAQGR